MIILGLSLMAVGLLMFLGTRHLARNSFSQSTIRSGGGDTTFFIVLVFIDFGILFCGFVFLWLRDATLATSLFAFLFCFLALTVHRSSDSYVLSLVLKEYRQLKELNPSLTADEVLRQTAVRSLRALGWKEDKITAWMGSKFSNGVIDLKLLAVWILIAHSPTEYETQFEERQGMLDQVFRRRAVRWSLKILFAH